jgi:hypothetical protein
MGGEGGWRKKPGSSWRDAQSWSSSKKMKATMVSDGPIRYNTCDTNPRSGVFSSAQTVACMPESDLFSR